LKIEALELRKINIKNSRMRAIGKIILSNGLHLNDIRVIEGDEGIFIAMPIPKGTEENKFNKIINKKIRGMIERAILDKYKEL
jgi:stage V sporulation protein G